MAHLIFSTLLGIVLWPPILLISSNFNPISFHFCSKILKNSKVTPKKNYHINLLKFGLLLHMHIYMCEWTYINKSADFIRKCSLYTSYKLYNIYFSSSTPNISWLRYYFFSFPHIQWRSYVRWGPLNFL